MSEDAQIEGIKNGFLTASDVQARKKAFDALGTFGNKGITAINELIMATGDPEVKAHGFEIIKKTKEKS